MKLSGRLLELAQLVDKHKNGTILADIGTDHAYLPCYLIEKNIIEKAYACDVAQGPFKASLSNIEHYHFEEKIEALLGNGLNPILDKDVSMITIAGIGAFLIGDILDENKDYIDQNKLLFLQPNANSDHLREYLFKNNFTILDEKMIQDGHHIYEMMVVKKVNDVQMTKEDLLFGPVLRKEKSDLFIQYWKKQYKTYQRIQKDLPKEHQRYQEIDQILKLIEGELNESL